MRGTIPPEFGLMKKHARRDRGAAARGGRGRHAGRRRLCRDGDVLRAAGGGLKVVDGQQIMLDGPRDQELGRDHAAQSGGRAWSTASTT